MENRIKKVMSEVLNLDINEITDDTSQETVEIWDSLKHMDLVVALEEEFNIEFSDEDIDILLNFKLIKMVINEKSN